MTDIATLQSRLTEAENALHQINLGQNVAEIWHGNNERMRFNNANVAQLRAYIAELKGQLAALGVQVSGNGRRIRARRVYF
jgi:hypothetical protein